MFKTAHLHEMWIHSGHDDVWPVEY